MRLAIIVPTTAGPARVVSLKRREGLQANFAGTDDDYIPLREIGKRYDDFLAETAPIRQLLQLGEARFELRFDHAPETGRSWELPIALAHWAESCGHVIVTDHPDIVVWATAAVQPDLHILPDEYHLASKLRASSDLLTQYVTAGAHSLVMLPEGEEARQAEIPAIVSQSVLISTLSEAFSALSNATEAFSVEEPKDDRSFPHRAGRRKPRRYALAAVLAVLVAGGALYAFYGQPHDEVSAAAPEVPDDDTALPSAAADQNRAVSDEVTAPSTLTKAETDNATSTSVRDPALHLVEHRVPDGGSCIDVLFERMDAIKRTIDAEGGRFPESSGDGLCMLEFANAKDGSDMEIIMDPSFLKQVLQSDRINAFALTPGGSRVFRLIDREREAFSYSFSVSAESLDTPARFTHRLSGVAG